MPPSPFSNRVFVDAIRAHQSCRYSLIIGSIAPCPITVDMTLLRFRKILQKIFGYDGKLEPIRTHFPPPMPFQQKMLRT
ncbi:hypothetical protein M378DRAFT_169388 [Amanita muscaria Koide BX008]|uniref:Uncharacterized protein n=1 Tax=Amanita muscaria (strain Koide BX008) TaxID=946122 RepID=A0A0C2WSV5_AMAMK|nr:hypothetical protein M378DRAFT_169388 [Amanita muscaria Koide BX008]